MTEADLGAAEVDTTDAGAADVAWARRLAGHVDTGHPGVTGVTGVA